MSRSALRSIAVLIRCLPRASAGHAALLAATSLILGLLPVGFAIATGSLVGSISPAVRFGLDSQAGRRTTTLLLVVGALYVAQGAIGPIGLAIARSLGSHLSVWAHERIMRATLAPVGVGHLEDPAAADEIERARRFEWEAAPFTRGIVSVAEGATSIVTGLGSAAVLARFRWWAPVLGGVAMVLTHPWMTQEEEIEISLEEDATLDARRAAYYFDVGVRAPAAKEVRLFGLAGWVAERYRRHRVDAKRDIWAARRRRRPLLVRTLALIALANAAVFVALARAGASGEIGIGGIATYAQAAFGLELLGYAGWDWWTIRGSAPFPGIVALMARLSAGAAPSGHQEARGMPRSAIRFEQVHFSYGLDHAHHPGASRLPETPVLEGLELEIRAGESLAIVGANGAGKTTLIKLLTRLYEPSHGAITIDGVDMRELDVASWRRQIGVIFQDFVRYELPLRENVGFGRLDLLDDDRALAAAAAKTGADRLAYRWDTVLSRTFEDGAEPSGGEWQRIALARAMLAVEGGARVLVLDEPTASLDVRAEVELFDRFLELTAGLTTILVSHRFSTVRRAHRICVLEGGRVIEDGAHSELMALGGRYAQMFSLQAERFAR